MHFTYIYNTLNGAVAIYVIYGSRCRCPSAGDTHAAHARDPEGVASRGDIGGYVVKVVGYRLELVVLGVPYLRVPEQRGAGCRANGG